MTWYVDDIPLSTLAFNVQNRGAGWQVPAKRGENVTIPGRHGSTWVPNKPYEEGTVPLSMWALGANPDGSMPENGDQRQLCRYNLDKLTALFGQTSRLLNLVQVSGSAFGVTNAATNPAFERAHSSAQLSYQNSIRNPRGVGTSTQTVLTNLFPNPRMRSFQSPEWPIRFENLYPDPNHQYGRDSGNWTMASNFISPANFEGGPYAQPGEVPGGWVQWSNGRVRVWSLNATDQAQNPHGGSYGIWIQATANVTSPTTLATKAQYNTVSYRVPVLSFRYRRTGSTSAAQTFQIRMLGEDGNGNALGSSSWQTFTLPDNATDWNTGLFVPDGVLGDPSQSIPVIYFQVRTGEAWNTDDGIFLDQLNSMAYPTYGMNATGYWANNPSPGPFFDGNSSWGGLEWNAGGTLNARAIWRANHDNRWIADPAVDQNSAYFVFTDRPDTDPSGRSLNFHAYGFTSGQTQGWNLPLADPDPNRTYTLRFRARAWTNRSCRVVLLKQSESETEPTEVTAVDFVGAATPTTTGSRFNGELRSFEGEQFYDPEPGDRAWVRVEVKTQTSGRPILQLDQFSVTDAFYTVVGSQTDQPDTRLSWAGDPYNSKSIGRERQVSGFVGTEQSRRVDHTRSGDSSPIPTIMVACTGKGRPTAAVTEQTPVPTDHQGFWVAVDVWGQGGGGRLGPPRVRLRLELIGDSGVLNTFTSLSVTIPNWDEGSMRRITLRAPDDQISADAAWYQVRIEILDPLSGDRFQATNLLISPIALDPAAVGAPEHFDGSVSGAVWDASADNSASLWRDARPSRWSASDGIILPSSGAGVNLLSPITAGLPQALLSTALDSVHPAGDYLVGLRFAPQLMRLGRPLPTTGGVSIQVWATDASGDTQGFAVAGIFPANWTTVQSGSLQSLQGLLTATGSFSELTFWFVGSDGDQVRIEVDRVYLLPVGEAYTNPVQRIDFNALYNPNFVAEDQGWQLTESSLVNTTRGPGARVNTMTGSISSEWVRYPAERVQVGGWIRRGGGLEAARLEIQSASEIRNLAPDPSFEYGTGGFTDQPNGTVRQDATRARTGSQSLKLTTTSDSGVFNPVYGVYGANSSTWPGPALRAGDRVTARAWVYVPDLLPPLSAWTSNQSYGTLTVHEDPDAPRGQYLRWTAVADQPNNANLYSPDNRIPIRSGQTLNARFQIRKGNVQAPDEFRFLLLTYDADNKYLGTAVGGTNSFALTDDWVEYSFTGLAPAANATQVQFAFYGPSGTAANYQQGDQVDVADPILLLEGQAGRPNIRVGGNRMPGVNSPGFTGPYNTWTPIQVESTVHTDDSTLILYVYGRNHATSEVWFDDLSVMVNSDPVDFSGDSEPTAELSEIGWVGTPGASPSRALIAGDPIEVGSSNDDRMQLVTSEIDFSPTAPAQIRLSLSGQGAEIASGYLGTSGSDRIDTEGWDPDLFPFFDGSTPGPYGESTGWSGAAHDSASQVLPGWADDWGTPNSASAAVPHVIDPETRHEAELIAPPPDSLGSFGALPRPFQPDTRSYRMRPATQMPAGSTFLSGEVAIRTAPGASVVVRVFAAVNASATGTEIFARTVHGTQTVSWRDLPVSQPYVYLRLDYTETRNAPGYRVAVDNLLLLPSTSALGSDYPGYFDGSSNGAVWTGDEHDSASQYFGGGRRAYAEVREAIDFTSMAGGTRAEFAVNLAVPAAFWEDLLESTLTVTATRADLNQNARHPLDALVDTTAPIDDAVLTLTRSGPVSNVKLTDVATGARLTIAGALPSGDTVIDAGAFTVTNAGQSLIKQTTRSGSNTFLPLTPMSSTTPPTLAIAAEGSGSLTVRIVARRRYLIA